MITPLQTRFIRVQRNDLISQGKEQKNFEHPWVWSNTTDMVRWHLFTYTHPVQFSICLRTTSRLTYYACKYKKPLQQRQDNTRMCKICVLGKSQEILLALGPARAHMSCSAYACFQGIVNTCNHFAYTNISVVRLYGLLPSSTTSGSLGQKVFRCFEVVSLLAPARETRKNIQKSKYRVTLTQFFNLFSCLESAF